jgi:flagellar basal-body rod protein FlgG
MNGAFYIGAIGMGAQQRALEVVANNIANINTVAFKRSTVRFSELLTGPRVEDGSPVLLFNKTPSLSGVTLSATPRVWSQGELKVTGQALDLAIDGDGFIELLGDGGHAVLWRGGTLKVNGDGYLATADGTVLKNMISVPQGTNKLTIDANGLVSASDDGETGTRQLGQIDLITVRDLDNLVELGDGRYEALDATETAVAQPGQEGAGRFVQGVLESANVQLTDEMMALLLLQRAFASNAQVVQASDQLMSIINGLRR